MLRRGSYTAGERFVPTKSDLSCRVLLMDGSDVVIDLGKKALGQVVFDHVLRRLEILDRDYFGLQLKDGNSRPVWMDFMKPAKKQLKKSSKIYFRVKYYPADPISCHGKARNQFYLQLRVDIAEGRLLCPPNTAPSFYSLILQADTGDYESDERDLEHLREHHLMVQSKSLMDEIIRFHKYHRGMNPQEAVNRFLKKAREIETYGMRFTDVKSEDDEVLYQLGLCPSGIALNRNTRVLNLYKWSRIAQVSYKGKQLTLRIKGHGIEEGKYIPVHLYLDTVPLCEELWQQCVEHLDFFSNPQHSVKSPPDSEDASSSPEVTPTHTSVIHQVLPSQRSSGFLHEHMSAHHILEQPELLSEEEERRRKRVRKVQSFPKKLPSEDPILAALMSKRKHREGRPSTDPSSPASPIDDPEETLPERGGFPTTSGRFARVLEERELLDDGDVMQNGHEAGNGAGNVRIQSKESADIFEDTQEGVTNIAQRDAGSVSVGLPGHEKVVVKEEDEQTKSNVPFDRFRRDRKSYMKAVRRDPLLVPDEKAVRRDPLLVPDEKVKQVVTDNTNTDLRNKMEEKRSNRDVVTYWAQDHQNSMPAEVPDNQDSFQDSWRPVALGPPVFVPVHYTVQSDGLQGKSMDSLPNHSKSDSTSTPDSLSLCRVPSANSDRASNTSGDQRPSNGNALRGQRPYSATAPRGQRPSSASAPGGHRPSSASTPVKRFSGALSIGELSEGGGADPLYEHLTASSSHLEPPPPAPFGKPNAAAVVGVGTQGPTTVFSNHSPVQFGKVQRESVESGVFHNHSKSDSLSTQDSLSLHRPPSGVSSVNSERSSTRGLRLSSAGPTPHGGLSPSSAGPDPHRGLRPSSAGNTGADGANRIVAQAPSIAPQLERGGADPLYEHLPTSPLSPFTLPSVFGAPNAGGVASPSNVDANRSAATYLWGETNQNRTVVGEGATVPKEQTLSNDTWDPIYDRLVPLSLDSSDAPPALPPSRTTPTSPPPSSGPVSRDLQPTPGSPATQSPSTQCPAPGPQNQLSPLLPPAQPSQLSSPPLHKQSPFPQVLPVSQTSPEQHHTSTSQVTRQHAAQTLVTSRSSQALTTPPPSQALPTPPLSQALPTPPPSQALPTPPPSLTPPTSQSSLPSQTPTPAAPSQTSTLPRSTPNAAYWPPSQSSSSSSQAPQPLPPFPQTRVSSASLHAPALPRFLQTIIPPPPLQALPPPPSQAPVPPPSSQAPVPPPPSQAPVPPPPSQTPPISQLPSASRTLKTPSTSAIVPPQSLGSWAETLAPSPSSQSIALTSSSLTPVPSPPSQSLSSLSSRTLPTSQTQQPAPPLSQDLESSDASVTRTSRTQLNGQTSSDDATTGGNVRQMRGPSISWNTLVREAMTAEDLPPPPPHLLALSRELASQDPRSLSNDQNRPLSKQPAACDINPDLLPSTGQLNPAFLTGKPAYSASQGMEQYPPEIASFMTRVKGQAGGEAKERGVTGTKNSPESRAKLQQSPSPSLIRRYKSARGPYTQAEILNNRREVRPNLPRNSSNTTTAPRKVSPAKEQYFANRGENEIQVGRLQDIFESFDSLFTSKLTLQPDLSPEKHLYPDGEHREMGQNITSADNRSRPTISSPSTGAVVLEPEETMSLQDQLKMLPNTKKSGKEKVMDWIERSSDLWSYDTQFPMLKDKDTGNPIPQQYQQQGHLYEDPAQVVQGGKSFFVDV